MSYTVVVTAPSLAPEGAELLARRGCTVLFVADQADEAGLRQVLTVEPVDAIVSRTMRITRDMMDGCPTLRVISKHGVGTSNIDTAAATELGIAIFSTPGANSRAVAEFTIALMLSSLRHVARFDRAIRSGSWSRHGDGLGLEGRRLGLVGYGRIARLVGDMARALGMRVLAYDPFVGAAGRDRENVEFLDDLDTLLSCADVLSLHCPARLGEPPLIDSDRLARLPPGAVLVNTARGELVDEDALAAALEAGRLSAAALDTFAAEPLSATSRLRGLENVILTPHVAGSTPEALGSMARGAAENLLGYLDALAARGKAGLGALSPDLTAKCSNRDVLARPKGWLSTPAHAVASVG